MSEEESGEKSHEPSQRKLDQARKKGEIARSADLITAASYACFLLVLMATGAAATLAVGEAMSIVLAQAHTLSDIIFAGNATPILGQVMSEIGRPILPWLCLPPLAAIGMIFAQKAFVFAPSKLNPRLSKISPIANAKNKFGASGLFEFLKSFVKLSLFSGCLGVFLWGQFPAVAESLLYSPSNQLALLGELALQFLLIVVLVMLAIGGVDFLWQRQHHLQKNRMTHKEVKDEHKDSEGDPHVKQQRRARAQEISSRQMVAEVKTADVVIVNPTHYSVALKWSREANNAPVCVAKGTDAVALQIREVARENGVPIHADPPTARALFASVDLGEQIHESHFRAVAVAIRFAEEMRKKARKWQ